MVKKILCAALLVAFASSAREPVTVGVLYFENNSLVSKEQYEPLRVGLCDMFTSGLMKIKGLRVVERARLEAVLHEQALGQTGAVDAPSAPQVGRLLGVQVLALGSYMVDLSGNIRIDARLVSVETGDILKAEEITGKPSAIFKMIKRFCLLMADGTQTALSPVEKRDIDEQGSANLEALVAYSKGLQKLDVKDTTAARTAFDAAVTADKGFIKAKIIREKL